MEIIIDDTYIDKKLIKLAWHHRGVVRGSFWKCLFDSVLIWIYYDTIFGIGYWRWKKSMKG